MINNISNFFIKFLNKTRLDTKRILNIYIYALILIPIFFGGFIILEIAITRHSLVEMLFVAPIVAVDMIIAITDFILGYFLWIKKDNILEDSASYLFFMSCQAIGQLMVGNIFCLVLALFGIIRTYNSGKSLKNKNKLIEAVSILFVVTFIFCFTLIIVLNIKKK